MHFKLLFCIVLLQLLRYGDAGREDEPEPSVHRESAPPSRKGKEATVDLEKSQKRAPAISASVARWLTKPIKFFYPCAMQSVMHTWRPWWGKVLNVYLKIGKPYKYTFNIGDSFYNNAWGGNGNSYKWDAEIHNYGRTLYVYASEYGGNKLLYSTNKHWYKNWLLIRIYSNRVHMTNFQGWSRWIFSNKFFKMFGGNYVYIGINRVIKNALGSPSPSWYTGSGLCSFKAFWSG